MQEILDDFWLTANKKLRPSSGACKELNATNNHLNLEGDPFPVEPQMKPSPGCHLDFSLAQDPIMSCSEN